MLEPVVSASKVSLPTATLLVPLVNAPNASFPIAVLFPPLTEAFKAFSPKAVFPETEFVPLPTVTEFIVASAVEVIPPVKVLKSIQPSSAELRIFNKLLVVSAHNVYAFLYAGCEPPLFIVNIASYISFISALTLAPVELSTS